MQQDALFWAPQVNNTAVILKLLGLKTPWKDPAGPT